MLAFSRLSAIGDCLVASNVQPCPIAEHVPALQTKTIAQHGTNPACKSSGADGDGDERIRTAQNALVKPSMGRWVFGPVAHSKLHCSIHVDYLARTTEGES